MNLSNIKKNISFFLCLHLFALVVSPFLGLHICHSSVESAEHPCAPRCSFDLERRADCRNDDCPPESPLSHVIDAADLVSYIFYGIPIPLELGHVNVTMPEQTIVITLTPEIELYYERYSLYVNSPRAPPAYPV